MAWRVSLYVAIPPAIVAIDLLLIVHLSLSRKLHLAPGSSCGSRCTTHLSESACASQDALRPAVFQERTNIDCSHHASWSILVLQVLLRMLRLGMLKKVGEGSREVVKLDIGEEHSVHKCKKLRRAGMRPGAECRACAACEHSGRTDLRLRTEQDL